MAKQLGLTPLIIRMQGLAELLSAIFLMYPEMMGLFGAQFAVTFLLLNAGPCRVLYPSAKSIK